jgi:hypothetical protein
MPEKNGHMDDDSKYTTPPQPVTHTAAICLLPMKETHNTEEAPSWIEIGCVLSYKKKDQCSVSYMRLLLPHQTWYPIPSPHQLQHPNPIGKIN